MRKIIYTVLLLVIILMLLGKCEYKTRLTIRGSYQSEIVNGHHVQITIQQDDYSFVEYIDNREVDRGTYEETENNIYIMKSDKQNFEIILNDDNSFEIFIKKLNDGNPIKMIKVYDTPTYFATMFDDVDIYKTLIE